MTSRPALWLESSKQEIDLFVGKIPFDEVAKYLNSPETKLFKKSEILKLSDLYEHQAAFFVNDYVMTRLPQSFRDLFRLNGAIQEAFLTR